MTAMSQSKEPELLDSELKTVDLLLDVDQKPAPLKGLLLSFQHVFAMFVGTDVNEDCTIL